jgi:hypothetical protein
MELYATNHAARERSPEYDAFKRAFLRHSVAAAAIAEPAAPSAAHQFVNYITGTHHFLQAGR